jgi:hypothetical protein
MSNRSSNIANNNIAEQITLDNSLLQIANATMPMLTDDADQRRYVMQQQLYQYIKANPNMASQHKDLKIFVTANEWTGLDFIDKTGYYLANGDLETANLLLNLWRPSTKELDNNYYTFYTWIAAMQTTLGWKPNQTEVFTLANKCPLKSGNVVFAARNLYNSMTHKINKFNGDCIVNKSIKPQTSIVTEQIQVYPNPTNGLINVKLPAIEKGSLQISITDVYGKKVAEKKIEQNTMSTQLNIVGAKGLYFINVYNSTTGKQQISKIILQ